MKTKTTEFEFTLKLDRAETKIFTNIMAIVGKLETFTPAENQLARSIYDELEKI